MKAAKVKFQITMEYETDIIERIYPDCPEDNMNILEAIKYEEETLQEYREDLYAALDDSKLVQITIEEVEHYDIQDQVIDYQI